MPRVHTRADRADFDVYPRVGPFQLERLACVNKNSRQRPSGVLEAVGPHNMAQFHGAQGEKLHIMYDQLSLLLVYHIFLLVYMFLYWSFYVSHRHSKTPLGLEELHFTTWNNCVRGNTPWDESMTCIAAPGHHMSAKSRLARRKSWQTINMKKEMDSLFKQKMVRLQVSLSS